jgi:hypothetical protein
MYSPLNSSIVTISVGATQRLFAAHEDVLCKSPYFQQACQAQFFEPTNKRISLEHEDPEVFSAVLEYLYKGDYSPQLAYDKKRSSFYLSTRESTSTKAPEVTVQYNGVSILKDTAIYVRLYSPFTSPLIIQLTTTHSVPPTASPSLTCKALPSRNKAYTPVYKRAPSCLPPGMHTFTHPPTTRACVRTISHSSSEAAPLSSEVAPCRRR